MNISIAQGSSRPLQAGPVRMKFQDGELRYLYVGQREIVRRVYFAVRDERFETPMPVFRHTALTQTADGFVIRLAADCRNERADYSWTGVIEGRPDGTITFRVEGAANASFPSPRIGLNILFGTTLGSLEFTRVSAEGKACVEPFPREIALRKWDYGNWFNTLSYTCPDGLGVSAHIEGGHAGIEDQRNYGDSSYKVYSFMPYNYPAVPSGGRMVQTLTLTVLGAPPPAAQGESCRVRVGPRAQSRLPRIVQMEMPNHVEGYGFHVANEPGQFTNAAAAAWPFNPIVHLNDDDMIMENASGVADQVRLIRQWSPAAKIRIAPIFIRFPGAADLDARCNQPIAAAFSASLIAHMAGADEAAFALGNGPARSLLERLAPPAGRPLRQVEVVGPGPVPVDAFAVDEGARTTLWLVNRTAAPQTVAIDAASPAAASVQLSPYEVREVPL